MTVNLDEMYSRYAHDHEKILIHKGIIQNDIRDIDGYERVCHRLTVPVDYPMLNLREQLQKELQRTHEECKHTSHILRCLRTVLNYSLCGWIRNESD